MLEKLVVSQCISSDYCKGWNDAVEVANAEDREWELFDLITSVWYGKQYYFKQEDGTVYSRATHQYMLFDQAVDEFAQHISGEGVT